MATPQKETQCSPAVPLKIRPRWPISRQTSNFRSRRRPNRFTEWWLTLTVRSKGTFCHRCHLFRPENNRKIRLRRNSSKDNFFFRLKSIFRVSRNDSPSYSFIIGVSSVKDTSPSSSSSTRSSQIPTSVVVNRTRVQSRLSAFYPPKSISSRLRQNIRQVDSFCFHRVPL